MKDLLAGIVYLILDGEEAIGTVTIKENEICRLFVLPKYQHKGFGRQLLNFAERIIAEEYTEIYLDSSLPAKSTYMKRGYVSDYKDHPIKVLYENGVKVTINTDDLLLFDSSIENEYLLLYQTGALSAEQLNEVRKNGLGEAIG